MKISLHRCYIEREVGQGSSKAKIVIKMSTTPSLHGRVQKVFVGPTGLRTGWRVLTFLVVFVLSGAVLLGLLGFIGPALGLHLSCVEVQDPLCVLVQNLIGCLALVIAAGLMARIEKRRLGSYGLPFAQGFGLRLGEGILWGLGTSGLAYALLAAEGMLRVRGLALGSAQIVGFGLLWIAGALSIGIFEEWAFRGYLQLTLGSAIGFWPAALVISSLFGLVHMFTPWGFKWPVAVVAMVFGLFFCLTLRRTGSLWLAVGAHAAFDFTETFLFGSAAAPGAVKGYLLNYSQTGPVWLIGGASFPTGGLQVLIIWPLVALAFHLTHRKKANLL